MISTAEALLCGKFTPLGQVQIGPLDSLAGQLVPFQIPDNIISTLKLADLAVTAAKLGISSVSDSKVAAGAGILESKLNLDFPTTDLNTDIGLNAIDIASNLALILDREEFANKDAANGYLGLDAGAKVPLAKLNPLLNAQIAAAAAILESKLNLDFSTSDLNADIQTRLLAATYAAHDHSLADPTKVDHANLLNVLTDQHHPQSHTLGSHSTKAHSELTDVLTSQHHVKTVSSEISLASLLEKNHASLASVTSDQHHPQSHTLASHSTKAHSELTDVLTSQHHVKYTGTEAIAAVEAETIINLKAIEADGHIYPKITNTKYLGKSTNVFERAYLGSSLYFGTAQDVNLYRDAANSLKTDDVFNAGGGLKISGVTTDLQMIFDLLSYGSSNAAWHPLPFELCYPSAAGSHASINNNLISVYLANAQAIDGYWQFVIPLPTNKGSQSLRIVANGIRFYIHAANATNKVIDVALLGVKTDGTEVVIRTDPTDHSSIGLKTITGLAETDFAIYAAIYLRIHTANDATWALRISQVSANLFYL